MNSENGRSTSSKRVTAEAFELGDLLCPLFLKIQHGNDYAKNYV